MKTVLLSFAFFLSTPFLVLSQTFVPDDAFETYLINNGYDSGPLDDMVLTANISGITILDLTAEPIVDFTGIEDFSALESFTAGNTSTTQLDLSQNAALKLVSVSNTNALIGLDLAGLTNLLTVNNSNNGALVNFSVIGATALQSLTATQHFSMSNLDLSTQSNLTFLNVDDGGLTNLDLSHCTSLNTAFCGQNQITSILLGNIPLTAIGLNNNQIATIDLSALAHLDFLGISGNQLSILNVSNNAQLTHLSALNNFLTNIDISNNPILDLLWVDNNQITTITTGTSGVKTLAARNNMVTSLDVSQNAQLDRLYIPDNALTSLNLRNGNNTNIGTADIELLNNPQLNCVEVDDVAYSNTNWTNKDPQTQYSLDCNLDNSEVTLQDFRIYPNPTYTQLKIHSSNFNNFDYRIISVSGQIITTSRTTTQVPIDVSFLSDGLYFLEISEGKRKVRLRFIKTIIN